MTRKTNVTKSIFDAYEELDNKIEELYTGLFGVKEEDREVYTKLVRRRAELAQLLYESTL